MAIATGLFFDAATYAIKGSSNKPAKPTKPKRTAAAKGTAAARSNRTAPARPKLPAAGEGTRRGTAACKGTRRVTPSAGKGTRRAVPAANSTQASSYSLLDEIGGAIEQFKIEVADELGGALEHFEPNFSLGGAIALIQSEATDEIGGAIQHFSGSTAPQVASETAPTVVTAPVHTAPSTHEDALDPVERSMDPIEPATVEPATVEPATAPRQVEQSPAEVREAGCMQDIDLFGADADEQLSCEPLMREVCMDETDQLIHDVFQRHVQCNGTLKTHEQLTALTADLVRSLGLDFSGVPSGMLHNTVVGLTWLLVVAGPEIDAIVWAQSGRSTQLQATDGQVYKTWFTEHFHKGATGSNIVTLVPVLL